MKAKYRLKRKTFGLLGNIGGTALQATGSVADSGVGKAAGAIGGAIAGLNATGPLGKIIMPIGALGAIAGGVLGAKAAATGGKFLKQTGSDLRS